MNNKLKLAAGISAALAVGALLSPLNGANAGHLNALLEAELTGRQEVPAMPTPVRTNIGDKNGRGEAYVFGIDGDATTLCYVLTVRGIETASAAHIHEGARGVNGPIVANLGAPGDGNAADCLTDGEAGKFPTGETVAEILATPSDYYVNVHNTAFPSGAIRGQLRVQR